MRGRINEDGYLLIKRGSFMKTQGCPRTQAESCGGWCPMFGEPVYDDGKIYLAICNRNDLIFDELEDQRK